MQEDDNGLRKLIREELSKAEVRNMINSELESFLKEKELKKKIREITVDVFDSFFKLLWHRREFWKGPIRNG